MLSNPDLFAHLCAGKAGQASDEERQKLQEAEDEDVASERLRLQQDTNDMIKILGLRKQYPGRCDAIRFVVRVF